MPKLKIIPEISIFTKIITIYTATTPNSVLIKIDNFRLTNMNRFCLTNT